MEWSVDKVHFSTRIVHTSCRRFAPSTRDAGSDDVVDDNDTVDVVVGVDAVVEMRRARGESWTTACRAEQHWG